MEAGQSVSNLLARADKAAVEQDWQTASQHYLGVLKRFPANKKAQLGLAKLKNAAITDILQAADRATADEEWGKVEENLSLAVALGVSNTRIHVGLADAQIKMDAAYLALETLDKVLEAEPENKDALKLKSHALRDMGQGEEALRVIQATVDLGSEDVTTLTSRALTHRSMGDFETAADYFRQALVLEPENPTLHVSLAQITKFEPGSEHWKDLLRLLKQFGPLTPRSIHLHFALFKAYHDMQEYEAAFRHLRLGNELRKGETGYDFKDDGLFYAVTKVLFKDTFPSLKSPASTGIAPIFVTGLPRSGTTLVERILSQSPDVQPCGELSVVSRAIHPILRQMPKRAGKGLYEEDLVSIREKVLGGLSAYAAGKSRPVDKMPMNFRWIGYLLTSIPECKIVHLNRDPMAVAWSLFRHEFAADGIKYNNDPKDIVKYMAMHKDLMEHWRKTFPGQVIDVVYDDLVEDPESVTKALASATDLDWSPDWVAHEQKHSQIRTASAMQARQPIYKNSNDGWRAYEKELAPLREMLKQVGLIKP